MHSKNAEALLALSTSHEAWRELIDSYSLDWDQAETWLRHLHRRAMAPLTWALLILGTVLAGRLWRIVPTLRRRRAMRAAG